MLDALHAAWGGFRELKAEERGGATGLASNCLVALAPKEPGSLQERAEGR